jgi:hypothetical protein
MKAKSLNKGINGNEFIKTKTQNTATATHRRFDNFTPVGAERGKHEAAQLQNREARLEQDERAHEHKRDHDVFKPHDKASANEPCQIRKHELARLATAHCC